MAHNETWDFSPQEIVTVEAADMMFYMPEQVALVPAHQRLVNEIVRRSHAVGVPVSYAFSGPMFSGHLRLPGPERDWYFMPLEEDPLWDHEHGYPMPDRIISDLRRLNQAGIEFDCLYTSHEALKKQADATYHATRDRATPDMVVPPPSPKGQAASARLGGWAGQVLRMATWPMLGLGLGLVATGAVASAVAATAVTALTLDPILFGCVAADRRQGIKPNTPAAFVYLGHWTWAE